jgi:hypothetical protein
VVQLEKYFDISLYSHHFSLLSLTSLLSAPEREVTSPSDFKIVGALQAYHQYGVGFAPGFVNYKKGCTRLAVASDKVYQLLAHGRWFSAGTAASSTTKTCRHDIAEILLKVALNTKKIKSFGIHWVDTFTKCSKK